MSNNLPDPGKLAQQSAETVKALNETLRATNPSKATQKKTGPNKGSSSSRRTSEQKSGQSDLRKVADNLRSQITSLKEAEAKRKEYTPTISIGEEQLTLDYVGKVAGKSVIRQDPFAVAKDMSLLRPILQPIISVANGALRGTDFTAPFRFKDEKLKAYFKATPLDKASYAYETLLGNPEFVQKLSELNEVIEETFRKSGMHPKDVAAVSHDSDGKKVLTPKDRMDLLLQSSLNVTSAQENSKDDFDITD